MIRRWKVFNFKSVRKETDLELAPLTIFAGANSSGKSTFLQSMLIVAQTLAHKVSSRSVVLNGALTRLGQFDDLKSADSDANQIVIGWLCQPIRDPRLPRGRPTGFRRGPPYYGRRDRLLSSASCEVAFDTEDSGDQREVTQIQPRLFSAVINAVVRDTDGGDFSYSMTIRRASTADYAAKRRWIDAAQRPDDALARASMEYEVELDGASLAEVREDLPSAQPVGCVLRHFLPQRLSVGVDVAAENARAIVAALTGDGPRGVYRGPLLERDTPVPGKAVEFVLRALEKAGGAERATALRQKLYQPSLFDTSAVSLEFLLDALRGLPPPLRFEIRRALTDNEEFEELVGGSIREGQGEQSAVLPYRLPSGIAEASWYLDEFFATSLRYLGPLRDEPKSLYPLAPAADPADVGLKGEHTAAVLDLHKNRPVQYIPTSAFTGEQVAPTVTTRTLGAAVVDWLQYLGVAEDVQSRDKGKFGHELTVSVPFGRRPQDLTHVGVGVSQVLPILVASLLADPDTTLIFEQPELHLHPRVQTLLADFFLSMTRLGKQCVVETHSEYVVSRLRLRAAAASTAEPWVEAVRIYFVEKNEGGSSFREVKMNEYGAIPDWPDGFFDQSQREAESILRAAATKRKRRRETT